MKFVFSILICLLLISCNDNDSVISPETDFIIDIYNSKHPWNQDLYLYSKELLPFYINSNPKNLTDEIIKQTVPNHLKDKKLRIDVGTAYDLNYSHQKFYYLNSSYGDFLEEVYVGFAYNFTDNNDNSIYFCRVFMPVTELQ
ncbi:MAG: hypothetical protein RO257_10275 [Candidatus Kapabacteria bacterium]|nr:hypothetical protein [Candidatus Kapabacteria bacterium]